MPHPEAKYMSWSGDTPSPEGTEDHVIHWEAEVNHADRCIDLTARCECGHDFGLADFDHPEQVFEHVDDLACPLREVDES